MTPESYREGVRVMECGSYAGRCVFVMGAKEGPTRDLHRPTQEASLSVRVGRRLHRPTRPSSLLFRLERSIAMLLAMESAHHSTIFSCNGWVNQVGYTFPPRSPGDDRPLPLGVSMWFTHAHDPQELCSEEARGAR